MRVCADVHGPNTACRLWCLKTPLCACECDLELGTCEGHSVFIEWDKADVALVRCHDRFMEHPQKIQRQCAPLFRTCAQSDRFIKAVCPSFYRYALDLKDFAVWRTRALQPDRNPHTQQPPQQPQQDSHTLKQQEQEQEQQQQDPTQQQQQQQQEGPKQQQQQGVPPSPWVAIAKHLCGAATDYALRGCLPPSHVRTPEKTVKNVEAVEGGGEAAGAAASVVGAEAEDAVLQQFRGLCIATCCHHRCVCVCVALCTCMFECSLVFVIFT